MGPRTRLVDRLNELYRKFTPNEWLWLVSYSGGKDSTLLLLTTLSFAEEHGFKIHVVYNDSGGDLPELRELTYKVLGIVAKRGHKVHITKPEKTFFDYLLTKYSPPRWNFRWCCKRLKEEPFKKLAQELAKKNNVLNLIGTRSEESRWRNWYIKRASSNIIYVAPLYDYKLNDIWHELRQVTVGDFAFIFPALKKTYNGANRSGCWFCPLVTHDNLLRSRPELLKLKYKILLYWCSGKREKILELAQQYPNLIRVTIKPEDISHDYPCKRRCSTCQVNKVRQNILRQLMQSNKKKAIPLSF